MFNIQRQRIVINQTLADASSESFHKLTVTINCNFNEMKIRIHCRNITGKIYM
jgi:hypothetical protein